MNLNGKTALVTGGAVRLGRAICIDLARRGCNVVVHYHRSARPAASLVVRLRAMGVRAAAISGNLDTPVGCERVATEAVGLTGCLDVLVNNASVFHKHTLVAASESEIFNELNVNLLAPLWMTKAFARRSAKGKIINLLDRRISSNEPGMLPYLLSKKALADFTALAALELAPGISVNGIAPGPVLGPAAWADVREKAGQLPLRRRPSVKDIVIAAGFLIECDSITGQLIFVDGGQHLL